MSTSDRDFDPAAIATQLVNTYGPGAAEIAEAIGRALNDDPHTAMLRRVARVWGLSTIEVAYAMGDVSRQAAAQWVGGDRPVPAQRRAHLADLAAATDLLQRYVKAERIPAVVRRPAEDLRAATLLDLAHEGRTDELLAYLRALFDYRQLHS